MSPSFVDTPGAPSVGYPQNGAQSYSASLLSSRMIAPLYTAAVAARTSLFAGRFIAQLLPLAGGQKISPMMPWMLLRDTGRNFSHGMAPSVCVMPRMADWNAVRDWVP